jgi:hypothetical protein
MVEFSVPEVLKLMRIAEILATPVGIPTVRNCAAAVAIFIFIPLVAIPTGAEARPFFEARGGISRGFPQKGHYMRVISFRTGWRE